MRLLRISNGLQINNSYFKEGIDLVGENQDRDEPEIMILGNQGNMAEYVFDLRDRKYHTINMGYPDESFASFSTFEKLLKKVLDDEGIFDE